MSIRIHTKAVSIVSGMVVAAVSLLGLAAPASASTTYYYNVDPVGVCNLQGHFGASFYDLGPYGWYCYDVQAGFELIPPHPTITVNPFGGGLGIQAWCRKTYPDSNAELVEDSLFGWKCAKREA